tara:strand:- start:6839 stop:7192 length:354 start_codon:yes stop_codon:yes gene_type:complete
MKKLNSDQKRVIRNRRKLKKVNIDRYRITVSKSLKNISAQIIDDKMNKTIVSASSTEKDFRKNKKNKTNLSTIIGEALAKRAVEKKISKVYFDRGGYKYHGRVKALADSLRKNGLNF